MKKILVMFCGILLTGFVSADVIYSNSFDDVAGTLATDSVPEINTIVSYVDAATANIKTDGAGRLEATAKTAAENYRFRLNPTALNLDSGLSGIKATAVLRAPSTTDWIGLSFGGGNANGVLHADANATWIQIGSSYVMIRGGEGTSGSSIQSNATHTSGALITLEYTYNWDKTVDVAINGSSVVSGLAVSYINAATTLAEDPTIIWAMITMRNQDTIANGGAYIDSLTIETIPEPTTLGLFVVSSLGVVMLRRMTR